MKKRILLCFTLLSVLFSIVSAKTILTTELFASGEPYYIQEGTTFTGVALDIINEINTRSNLVTIKHTNKLLPPGRSIKNVTDGKIDLIMTLSRTTAREKTMDFIDTALYPTNISLFALTTNTKAFQIKSLDDITGTVLGITAIRATKLAESLGLKVQPAHNLEQNIRKLMANRGEYFVYNALAARAFIKEKGLQDKIKECYVLQPNSHNIAFKKGTSPKVLNEVNKIVIEMQNDGTMDKILHKWF